MPRTHAPIEAANRIRSKESHFCTVTGVVPYFGLRDIYLITLEQFNPNMWILFTAPPVPQVGRKLRVRNPKALRNRLNGRGIPLNIPPVVV